jgi:hypothetical protein
MKTAAGGCPESTDASRCHGQALAQHACNLRWPLEWGEMPRSSYHVHSCGWNFLSHVFVDADWGAFVLIAADQ